MAELAQALGDSPRGAIAARGERHAGQPAAGEHPDDDHGTCLNCGTRLIGDYCHGCGQQGHVHRTLGAFWHDLLHGVLHFEGKIWRTLPLLALRPGELTRRYIDGERARYVSPLAMFLFAVFLMFAVFGSIGGMAYRSNPTDTAEATEDYGVSRSQSIGALNQRYEAERQENLRELEALGRAQERLRSMGRTAAPIARDMDAIRREMVADERIHRESLALQRIEEARLVAHRKPVNGVEIHPRSGPSLGAFDTAYAKAKENPKLLVYKLQTSAYKFSWALIPILLPFVALLFLGRRRFSLYDHAVFVTYSLTFMSLFAIGFTLLKLLGLNGTWALLPFVLLPVHVFRHLRGTYLLSAFGALWRTAALGVFAAIAAALFFAMLLTLGVLG